MAIAAMCFAWHSYRRISDNVLLADVRKRVGQTETAMVKPTNLMLPCPLPNTVYELDGPFELKNANLGPRLFEAFKVKRVRHLGNARLAITGFADIECHLADASTYTFTVFSPTRIALVKNHDIIMVDIEKTDIFNELFLQYGHLKMRKIDDEETESND
ncbi:MAG TPA: hypothetical protein VGI40_12270 [Pirellulaceae bacterium]|jgi:hypothetical protein